MMISKKKMRINCFTSSTSTARSKESSGNAVSEHSTESKDSAAMEKPPSVGAKVQPKNKEIEICEDK